MTLELDVVDSQVHLFHKMGPEPCLAAMDALGVRGLLIDERWQTPEQDVIAPPYIQLPNGARRHAPGGAQSAAMRWPERFRYLRRIDHRDPDLALIIRQAAEDPMCVALRSPVWPKDVEDFRAGRYRPVFVEAARHGLPVFVLTSGHNAELAPYVAEIGDCRFILDHVGLVKTPQDWDFVLGLARHPNLSLKWCHANLAFPPGAFPYPAMQAGLKQAVEAFGRERVMWASDFTMLRPQITWAEALFYVRECELLSAEDRAWVLGRAARTTLGWPIG